MPPPTAMKSLWQAAVACCAALNSAASRLSITMWRPLMPPEALHQCRERLGLLGELGLESRLNGVGRVVEHGDVDGLRAHTADRGGTAGPGFADLADPGPDAVGGHARRQRATARRRRGSGRRRECDGRPCDHQGRHWPAAAPTFEARPVLCRSSPYPPKSSFANGSFNQHPDRIGDRAADASREKMHKTGPSPAGWCPPKLAIEYFI